MPLTLTTFDDAITTPTNPTFSQEIFDSIIDNLYSHKPTLLICSIVCKSWLPRCRYYLFSTVDLTPKLVKFLTSSPHSLNTIVPYIKDAFLGGAWLPAQREEYDQVISLVLNLDGVRGLSIETWSWDFISPISKGLILNANGIIFQNITRLHLQYLRFPSFDVLATAISSFSNIEDLSFDNVTWDQCEHQISSPILFPQLKKLHIRSSLVQPILGWLFGSMITTAQALHSLSLPELLSSDIHVVGHLLRTLGPSLRHFEVGFLVHNYDNQDMRNLSDAIDFSYNRGLRTLRLHHLTLYQLPPTNHDQPLASPVSWLVPFLSNVASSLVELSLYMWLSQEAHLDLIDWPALSHVLTHPSFGGLDMVQFQVLGLREGRDDLKGWLVSRLSTWQAARNVVQVVFV
ncbi:hypothetical protein C0991_002515 [Blastosporella zonata]|nr:hypothetical protein C0991_002515 [Blastosporella zonata]